MSVYDGLPTSIRVGAYDTPFQIEENLTDEDGTNLWGWHKHGQWIKLEKNIPTALIALETVLHEVIHAIDRCANINVEDSAEQMERMAGALGSGLTQVFLDNPKLVAWIVKTLGSTSSDTKTCHCLNSSDGDFLDLTGDWQGPTMASSR